MSCSRLLLTAGLALALLNCGKSPHEVEEKYYLVSHNTGVPYWQEAFAGLRRAASQLQVNAEMVGPQTYDPKVQEQEFRRVMGQKPTGILVSASDPNLLRDDIDAAIGQGIPVITIDSDAPESKRLMFIGTDNYRAGVMGARVLANKLNGKGNVVVFTNPEQPNLKDRLRGYNDVLAEHPQLRISQVVDIKGDPRVVFDRTTEMLEKGANVDGFVCLVSIAGPEVAEVLSRSKANKVVVAMDTDQRTLEGVKKGLISATIGQKPFTMAFLGLKALDDLYHHPVKLGTDWARNSFAEVPAHIDTGVNLIDQSNVDGFMQEQSSTTASK